eukprot:1465341-Rhodomonas_salina.1
MAASIYGIKKVYGGKEPAFAPATAACNERHAAVAAVQGLNRGFKLTCARRAGCAGTEARGRVEGPWMHHTRAQDGMCDKKGCTSTGGFVAEDRRVREMAYGSIGVGVAGATRVRDMA